ncbi:MAG: hypothetical protein ABW168_15925 [Sedimenticola sp.]
MTKRVKNAEASSNLCPRCETEILAADPQYDCAVCGVKYCLKCTNIPLLVYEELEENNIPGFSWHCRSCKMSLPTLRNMDKTLKSMDEKNENRLSQIESKLDKLDTKIVEKIKEQVDGLKVDVVGEIKSDMEAMIDARIKEYEDQQHRIGNIIVYNLPEIKSQNSEIRKTKDEENFRTVANSIGITDLQIKASIRLGKMVEGNTRPMKVVLENKQQRQSLLNKSREISTKSQHFKDVVIARDLTPKQRDESKKLRAELQIRRNAGEIVTIRQGKVVELKQQPKRNNQSPTNSQHTSGHAPRVHTPTSTDQDGQADLSNGPNMDISSIPPYNDDTVIGGIPSQYSVLQQPDGARGFML